MTPADLVAALDLPTNARVNLRVPKKLLVENGAPTATDKRQINDGIEDIHLMGILKPATVGVPEYRDDVREYLEIAVLHINLRTDAKVSRLAELVHRAIPYPVFLVLNQGTDLGISLAHQRKSQGDAAKVVLDDERVQADLDSQTMPAERLEAFLGRLALPQQPRTHLLALYQGWIDTLLAFHAAHITGTFSPATTVEHATTRRSALRECRRLEEQMAAIRTAMAKETQMARKVESKLELKRLQAALTAAQAQL